MYSTHEQENWASLAETEREQSVGTIAAFVLLVADFLAAITGNLLAAWIQQDVLSNYFSRSRVTTAIVVAVLMLVFVASFGAVKSRRNGEAVERFHLRSSLRRGVTAISEGRLKWVLVGVLLVLVVLLGTAVTRAHSELERFRFPLDNIPTHLGDNVFGTFGVSDPAQIPDPSIQEKTNLVFFNKATEQFEASSLSTSQETLLYQLADSYSKIDFSSYQHVRLIDLRELSELGLNPLPSPRVVPFGGQGFLVWKNDQGNFHQSRAAVLVSYRIDLTAAIEADLPTDTPYEVNSVHVALQLAHGGVPQGEGGRIWLVVNGHFEDLSEQFRYREGQKVETIKVDATPWIIADQEPIVNDISVVTSPIFESSPTPGPEFSNAEARPVHFRDVMLNKIELFVDVEHDA